MSLSNQSNNSNIGATQSNHITIATIITTNKKYQIYADSRGIAIISSASPTGVWQVRGRSLAVGLGWCKLARRDNIKQVWVEKPQPQQE